MILKLALGVDEIPDQDIILLLDEPIEASILNVIVSPKSAHKFNESSKDDEVDELLGLKLGADDFVKKSGGFSTKVLIERIRVQLRKKDVDNSIEENKSIISHGKLKLDPSQLECEWNGKQLPDKLTTTEFLIVKELAKRPGIIKERAQLMLSLIHI